MSDSEEQSVPESETTHVIVGEFELESRTASGWRFVKTIQTSEPVRYMLSPTDFGTANNGWTTTPEKHAEQVGVVTKYLLARGRDAEMSFLHQRIAELSADLETATNDAQCARTVEEMAVKERDELQARYDRDTKSLRQEADSCRDSLDDVRKKWATEIDDHKAAKAKLAKLTKAFGELQVQQVLGSDSVSGYTQAR